MDSYVAEQESTLDLIKKVRVNYKKQAKTRISKGYVQTRIDTLDQYWSKFQETHFQIVRLATALQRKEHVYFKEDIFFLGEDEFITVKSELADALETFNIQPVISTQNYSPSDVKSQSSPSDVKLPKIVFPQFSGNYEEWTSFRDIYISLVHDKTSVSKVQKLHYLKSSVTGEAEQLLRHLQITDKNYDVAWETLDNRYNNKRMIVNTILNRLMNQRKIVQCTAKAIKEVLDTTQECLNSLNNNDVDTSQWDTMIIYIILNKLDEETHKQWEEEISGLPVKELPKLAKFTAFLETRFRVLEMVPSTKERERAIVRQRSFLTSPAVTEVQCSYCKQNHPTYQCKEFSNLDVNSRVQHVQNERLCFNCLSPKHNLKNCMSKKSCHVCHKRHHSLIHYEKYESSPNKSTTERDNSEKSTVTTTSTPREEKESTTEVNKIRNYLTIQNNMALMATALVNIETGRGLQLVRALIDPCSQETFISDSAVQRLQLRRRPADGLVTGVGQMSTRIKYATDIAVYPRFNNSFKTNCKAFIIQTVTDIMPVVPVHPQNWAHIQHLSLADPTYHTPGNIDLLIGVNIYTEILMSGVIKGDPGTPIAQQTRFGWILSGGQVNNGITGTREMKSMHLNITLEKMVEKFWETERLESEENDTLTQQELRAEKIYNETLSRDPSGRYIVALPFKNGKPTLPENSRDIALRRLMSVERRLSHNRELRESYNDVMRDYITVGHMELVDKNELVTERDRKVYLPHHAVVREDRETTRVRIVYDASCKGTNGVSLNDELLIGPSLLGELRDILMRWRMHKVCFVADIIKMYRQIMVRREDTDFQRILWRFSSDEDIQEYRLLTVTFGTSSAPFLAVKTLRQVAIDEANTEEFAKARDIINHSVYMDDILAGGDTEVAALEAKQQLITVLRRGGFELQKWSSNSKEFINTVEPEKRAKKTEIDINNKETIKTLGVTWNTNEDKLSVTNKMTILQEERVTKRNVLTVIASLFDPMGWLAPSVVMAKIFMQKLWSKGLAWDEDLPEDLKSEWKMFCNGLKNLTDVKLERWIGTSDGNQRVELHGFSDASMAAYAAVVYCRVIQSDGQVQVSLIMAKTKIAPLKQLTLPRLELSATLLLSQLLKHVATAMRIDVKNTYAWTDSKVTLAWILGDPLKWTTFVKNRVIAIHNNINTTWSYINTKENPADPASRGVSPEKLKENMLWLRGPTFLKQKELEKQTCELEIVELEVRKTTTCASTAMKEKEDEFILNLTKRYSSLRKLIAVIAYCRRWLSFKKRNVNKLNFPAFVTCDERESALTICIKLSQDLEFPEEIEALKNHRQLKKGSRLLKFTPFLDEKGVLRVGGRLKHADLEFLSKHPVILSKHNVLIQLLLNDAHKKTLHGGPQLMTTYLRTKYWLIDAGNTVKTYVRNCVPCAKQRAKTITQLMGDLPEIRVKPSRPFLVTGVDFAGPINVRMSPGRGSKSYKAYICIFICMVTKAIHIECVSNLTMEAFMAAFRRFTSRRGFVREMWSDHGTNFIAASKELLEMWKLGKSTIPVELTALLDTESTKWKFIPPGSPNHGGLWEAGVRSIKFHLKRTIGDSTPTFEEMSTLLTQIEACLNSRPLSPLSDHPDDLEPLTPAHFLVGEPLITIPESDLKLHKTHSLSRWQNIQKMLQVFWKKWQSEYLTRLQERPKWKTRQLELDIGDLVLIKDERLPPSKWLLGRVIQKYPGRDNMTRTYDIRTATGVMTRTVSKLCQLPDVTRKDTAVL